MRLKAFASPEEFRAWLIANHGSVKELLVRCYKSHARDRGLTYRQAVDEALCFGWIDGVRRAVDEDTFSVRFTPRKPKSYWSAVNIPPREGARERRPAACGRPRSVRGARDQEAGTLLVREQAQEPRCPLGKAVPCQPTGMDLFSGAGALVSPHQHLLGDGGQAGGDPGSPPGGADRQIGPGAADQTTGWNEVENATLSIRSIRAAGLVIFLPCPFPEVLHGRCWSGCPCSPPLPRLGAHPLRATQRAPGHAKLLRLG